MTCLGYFNRLINSHMAAGDFSRPTLLLAMFQGPVRVWVIDPSLPLVHVCGTVYHFISMTLNCHFSSY